MIKECSSPLYRIDEKDIPRKFLGECKRDIRNGGIVFGFDAKAWYELHVPKSKIQQLPCGQCAYCRGQRAREWAIRCVHEAELYDHNYFVTLTYDNVFLPIGNYLDRNGVVKDSTLVPKHAADFVKRLRAECDRKFNHQGIRVFYSGEYGDQGDRPHYHLLLFNMPDLYALGDLHFWKKTAGYTIYRSDLIERVWSTPRKRGISGISMGFSTICDFTFETAAYVAQYTYKKLSGLALTELMSSAEKMVDVDDPTYEVLPRVQPFCHMSNRPGIGAEYYELHKREIREVDRVHYSKAFEAFDAKPPRYYDKLFDAETGYLDELKEWRHCDAIRIPQTDMQERDYLRMLREKSAREEEKLFRKGVPLK